MLRELRVKNYAIIDNLSLEFMPGLNVITGETGAGKSILIGALGLALGQRASSEAIKSGEDEASVEAFFDIKDHPVLRGMGIDTSEGILIRRTVTSGGKGRAFINDTMISVQGLATLGRTLVDMHGQHEHQSLLEPNKQLLIIDRYGRIDGLREKAADAYKDAQALRRHIDNLSMSAKERAQRIDLLKFQVNEIEAAGLTANEESALTEERDILANLGRLKELLERAYASIYEGEGSCIEKLSKAVSGIKEMHAIDPTSESALSGLEQALLLAEDAALTLRGHRDKYDMDPARLTEVDDRIDMIRNLKRKYGADIEAVLGYCEKASAELRELENADETTGNLSRELEEKETLMSKLCGDLSKKRKAAARSIEPAIKAVLKDLALEKSDFKIDIKPASAGLTGADSVEFLFSANSGEPLRPLSKVASGGELSRVMLALKSVMREADEIPVLVFDEIDAGIGGKTARNVAMKLNDIASERQVLCITHLPQIAAVGANHLMIDKGSKNNRVCVNVKRLSGAGREEEIARMLGGSVTKTSLEHARELLEKVK